MPKFLSVHGFKYAFDVLVSSPISGQVVDSVAQFFVPFSQSRSRTENGTTPRHTLIPERYFSAKALPEVRNKGIYPNSNSEGDITVSDILQCSHKCAAPS